MIDPQTDALSFARYRKEAKSLNDRPVFLMWGAFAGVSAETVLITCSEQFQQAPSKAKSQVIYDWLVNQDNKKASRYGWGAINLQADGIQDIPSVNTAVNKIYEDSKYYAARKTWIGKLRNQLDNTLGNIPAPDMYDPILEIAIKAAYSSSTGDNSFSMFKLEKINPREQAGMVNRLKAMELLEKEFRKAGFNTAKMGFRLPFRFR
ncbi:hypothetical protein [Azospirillum doebereinerae]|uniref:Uncharacterized protein n=1 Tax=Azospirillum doebereinerae TaxID=92933 RepID=A0A3S1CGB0_9PROT|nr:hypothetical protein [Azospirillum doebereinerae]RUQ69291.1 hypothetical protein EJ913_16100 [Azospirillum doebereinerae]